MQNFVDLRESKGNYFVDNDGNIVLDLNCSFPLGYPRNCMVTEFLMKFIGGKEEITSDWDELIRENLLPVSPSGNNIVNLLDGSSATAANEAAIQAAFEHYATKHGRSTGDLCALGFEYGSHGQSPQTLSCSDPAVNLNQEPTQEWPIAPFPKMILPYAANE